MLKMYQTHTHSGGSPALWEEAWSDAGFDEALNFCEVDPLRRLFERYAQPGTFMLEGGCGLGQCVTYYAARGVRVIGLDFARETLANLHAEYPNLMLCGGDVAALPFRDESFHLYYSGGVVEHFEAGPDQALGEARRVLRPGGVLLISVPYISPLRRLLWPFRSSLWKRVSRAEVNVERVRDGTQFFQYIFARREFEKTLAAAGFRVIASKGYGILWGLYDVAFFQTLVGKLMQLHVEGAPASNAVLRRETREHTSLPNSNTKGRAGASSTIGNHRSSANASLKKSHGKIPSRQIIKRLIVSEDVSPPVIGLGVRLMRWACANMMMYVCVHDG